MEKIGKMLENVGKGLEKVRGRLEEGWKEDDSEAEGTQAFMGVVRERASEFESELPVNREGTPDH